MNKREAGRIKVLDSLPAHTEYLSRMALEDKYKKMYDLCESVFDTPMVQMYAGANYECLFCGGHYSYDKQGDGVVKHNSSCPCIAWKEIKRDR